MSLRIKNGQSAGNGRIVKKKNYLSRILRDNTLYIQII
jgi:hypothetical protein